MRILLLVFSVYLVDPSFVKGASDTDRHRAIQVSDSADLARAKFEAEISEERYRGKERRPLTPQQMARMNEIAAMYRQVDELCPRSEESAYALLRLSGLYQFGHQYQSAREVLEEAIVKHKGTKQERNLVFTLGLHYKQTVKDLEKAEACFKRAEELAAPANPDEPDVLGKAIQLQRQPTSTTQPNVERANEQAEPAPPVPPASTTHRDTADVTQKTAEPKVIQEAPQEVMKPAVSDNLPAAPSAGPASAKPAEPEPVRSILPVVLVLLVVGVGGAAMMVLRRRKS